MAAALRCAPSRSSTMAAWTRGRSLRTGRSLRNRQDTTEDLINVDYTKDPTENLKEILRNIISVQNVSKAKKLAYLNSLVKFFQSVNAKKDVKFSLEEILCCLRVSLFHDAKEIRAAGLRAIRYLVQDEAAIDVLWKLHFHHLIARSLDIFLDNQTERLQSLRLMRKIVHLCPTKFPSAFTTCLVSLAKGGSRQRDHILRACLATLSELVILNPDVVRQPGVISALLRNVLDCQHPRIAESLVGTILFLLNHPRTRNHIKPNVDLEWIIAPITDCHYRHSGETSDLQSDEKEMRFAASKMAILSALRSWPGIIWLCKPGDSGLQSLVHVLYLPTEDVRRGIIDILFELFRLPIPEWTKDFSAALLASDSSTMQESWKLYDGFVSEEGKCILSHLSYQRPNLIENYLALLLFAVINVGILEALVEVIVSSNCKLSIRSTVLLGELLHLANTRLPHECSHYSHCLPTLIAVAASSDVPPERRYRASAAVTCLNRLHTLKKRGPIPCSLFLKQLVYFSQKAKEFKVSKVGSNRLFLRHFDKDPDELTNQGIKDSLVLTSRNYLSWDWKFIEAVFKMPGDALKKLDDNNHKNFVRKIICFYKPTSKQFSLIEQTLEVGRTMAFVGCLLMDFLADVREEEGRKLLDEFLTDFGLCLSQVNTERAPLDAMFSPSRMMTTLSQYYFLFVGRLSHTPRGRTALENKDILQYFLNLVAITSHECYLKLIISSLDYSHNGLTRIILSKVLSASSEASRLYATNLMRILIRCRIPEFNTWGMELLVSQVYDKSRAVSLAALDILDEACDEQCNLEALISLKPSLLHLGDRGQLLLVRFMSLPSGFKYLHNANYVYHEMEKWKKTYNLKYVKIVEDQLSDATTRHQRGDDGNFQRRSNQKHTTRDVHIPPHLYGQLVQHSQGLELLKEKDVVLNLVHTIRLQEYQSDEQILRLKAALWALGHIGMSSNGVILLNEEQVIQNIVKLAEESPVFSIRGTCFYVLGLLAVTPVGAELLSQLGWESVRRNRREQWPTANETEYNAELPESCCDVDFYDDPWRSRESSRTSMDELNERITLFPSNLSDFGGLNTSNLNRSANRLHPSTSFDGSILKTNEKVFTNEKSRTLPPSNRMKSPIDFVSSEYHQRSISDPQNSLEITDVEYDLAELGTGNHVNVYPGSNTSLQLSPHANKSKPRLKVSVPKERNRSRSFNDTPCPFASNNSNSNEAISSCGKIRSASNIEIVNYADYQDGSKDEHGDSGHTSKSRSDSYTDSTSGIGSCDSNTCRLGVVSEHAQTLSPIASSTSLNTMGNKMVHHSDSIRKLANLRHTPVVLRRVTSITQGQLSNDTVPHESSYAFTMSRDAAGYAALRTVQRRRIVSVDADPWPLTQERTIIPITKTRSLESGTDHVTRLFTDFLHSTPYTFQPSPSVPKPSNRGVKDYETDDVKFIGLCLPIDINILFLVEDREEVKTSNLSKIEENTIETANINCGVFTSRDTCSNSKHLFEYHTNENCLKCFRITKNGNANANVPELAGQREYGKNSVNVSSDNLPKMHVRDDVSTDTTIGSSSSTSSTDVADVSVGKIETDRTSIRKEIMLPVICLTCSLVIECEQELLCLKQKNPSVFQDLCLYSEILNFMSLYNFPLSSRRFLHELFLDAPFDEIFEEPSLILNGDVTLGKTTSEFVE